jgi:hypothetical protein
MARRVAADYRRSVPAARRRALKDSGLRLKRKARIPCPIPQPRQLSSSCYEATLLASNDNLKLSFLMNDHRPRTLKSGARASGRHPTHGRIGRILRPDWCSLQAQSVLRALCTRSSTASASLASTNAPSAHCHEMAARYLSREPVNTAYLCPIHAISGLLRRPYSFGLTSSQRKLLARSRPWREVAFGENAHGRKRPEG